MDGGGIGGFGLKKEKKTPFKKTLKFPVPTGKVSVPHQNLFHGHETGHTEGSQKTCGRGFRVFSNKCSRSPRLSDNNLKVVGSTLKTTRGISLYTFIGEGGLPRGCLVTGSWWTGLDLRSPGWMSRYGMILLTQRIFRKVDLLALAGFGSWFILIRDFST